MNTYKLSYIEYFCYPKTPEDFRAEVVNVLTKIEPLVRACYDQCLDLDIDKGGVDTVHRRPLSAPFHEELSLPYEACCRGCSHARELNPSRPPLQIP